MILIKKIDIFLLKGYLQLFVGTFFICQFIFMMQFMWRYVDIIIGKGLSMDVLTKFFYYSGITLVPTALPLAILLSCLITYGNLGEKLEMLAMKASGISLPRIFLPIFLFAVGMGVTSFYFQNRFAPEATKQLGALIYSLKQKSPESEIQEGVFNNAIPQYNVYCERKDDKTGMLYNVMVYDLSQGYENAQIILADKATITATEDKKHMVIKFYGGERFRNMDSQSGNMLRASVPYMRETFLEESDIIEFDANLNMMDADMFKNNALTKDLNTIQMGIDSLTQRLDSMGRDIYTYSKSMALQRDLRPGRIDSAEIVAQVGEMAPFDTLLSRVDDVKRKDIWNAALRRSNEQVLEYENRALQTKREISDIDAHLVEWHRKFSISLSCLLFFLIGAPLGAIIRKGGLGLPAVVSVLIFIFYYIINTGAEKMAKNGTWVAAFGVWLSSAVLLPIGLWLVYKANKESTMFEMEAYRKFFRRIWGIREKRNIVRKEVIINTPNYPTLRDELQQFNADLAAYGQQAGLRRLASYRRMFFSNEKDETLEALTERMETYIEQLSNSRDYVILDQLNAQPYITPDAHLHPFRNDTVNKVLGALVIPCGIFWHIRLSRYRLRLWRDIQAITKSNNVIIKKIDNILDNERRTEIQ